MSDVASEQIFPDLASEQVPEPETSARQPKGGQEQQPEPPSGSAQSTPTEEESHGLENSTMQQWLRWLSEQVSGVADQLDEEERRTEYLTCTTTHELVSLRMQIQGLQEELTKAKERSTNTATAGHQAQVVTEPVGTTKKKATPEPVEGEALQTGLESERIIATLREELKAQEALREKEREQRKLAEEERRRMEESLRKSQDNNDRLREEKDKMQHEKDRLRRHAETKIECLKEELRQQKDRDDQLRAQVNRRLKQASEDFDRLYREHKQAESDYKKGEWSLTGRWRS